MGQRMATTSFALDIGKFAEMAQGRIDLVVRKLSLELFTRVILESPVGNPKRWKHKAPPGYTGGRFRGNWQVAIGQVPTGTLEVYDKEGTVTLSKADAAIAGVKAGDVIYMVNNLPYARKLEFGWSSQAPEGMVRTSIAEIQAWLGQAVSQAQKERS